MKTVIGPIASDLGHAKRQHWTGDLSRPFRTEAWALPATEYRHVQPASVPITIGHNPEPIAGTVIYLEHRAGRLWCVANLHDWVCEPDDGPTYFSAEVSHLDGIDIELRHVALTQRPAQIATRPLQWFEGDLNYRRAAPSQWKLGRFEREILDRAAASRIEQRSSRQALIIHEGDRRADLHHRTHPAEIMEAIEDAQWDRRPPGKLRKSMPYRGIIAVR